MGEKRAGKIREWRIGSPYIEASQVPLYVTSGLVNNVNPSTGSYNVIRFRQHSLRGAQLWTAGRCRLLMMKEDGGAVPPGF